MAVLVQEKTRRRRKRLFSKLISIVIFIGIVVSAFILGLQLREDGSAGPISLPGILGPKKIALSDVQEKLGELSWVQQDLLPVNDYSRPGTALTKINAIVIHYVGNPGTTAKQNRSYYGKLADSHETSASSNFLVGLDGEILECVPVNEVAYCSNNRNGDTLSIECCHPDESGKFTDDTYDAAVRLTAWLCNELHLDSSDLLRHYDVTGKECPIYFVKHEDAWETFKSDVQAALDALQAAPSPEESPSAS